ncbi:hypothetical protein HPB47_009293 [Ixodes persulcatus]|uniref:Uncharacterized protein n=1 Tax=Ixodes persulcatus TaxID=34615 RepID=A0AC60P2B3_IXOPE|nr:hypothetical protein HPB47_009293 [Ixodes persulcatus]
MTYPTSDTSREVSSQQERSERLNWYRCEAHVPHRDLLAMRPYGSQEDLKCCGLSDKSFRDWNDNMYFNCSRSNPSYERCSVPHSCCKRNDSHQVVSLFCGRGVLNQTDYDAWESVYMGNCIDAAHRYLRENVTLITGMCLVFVILLAFVQMVTQALVDEINAIRSIYDRFYERVYDMREAERITE